MTDVRSLLRSHQQSTTASRITHPFAAYNAGGALRCTACGIAVKPTAWDGHIVSKAHRKRAAALKAVVGAAEQGKGKRKEMERERDEDEEEREGKKRKIEEEANGDVDMDEDTTQAEPPSTGLPAGFFSDPSRGPPPREVSPASSAGDVAPAAPPPAAPSALDLEWDAFQRAILAPQAEPSTTDAYARATLFAEPELVQPSLPEGFPASLAPQPSQPQVQTATGEAPSTKEETEDEKRTRKDQEDRELIMDRILDEERAQEEADERVVALKNRLDALKRARREKGAKRA